MANGLGIGLVLPMMEDPLSGEKPPWVSIKRIAQRAEVVGFDTVWVVDELLWRVPDEWGWQGPRGFWEGVSMAGAVAASTSTVRVGSWVFSAAKRNPGLTVKMAETLDEISDGRFIFGLGSGHPADFGQGAAFGFPEEKTVSRYEEALEKIIVPALRGEIVSWDGRYHRAHELEIRPRGPRPGRIPLMLGGHGPRTMRLAAKHADIWSSAAMDDSRPEWFAPMFDRVEKACAEVGRDPATLERSIGVTIEATGEPTAEGWKITGPVPKIAESLAEFEEIGATRVELMVEPNNEDGVDTAEAVLNLLR